MKNIYLILVLILFTSLGCTTQKKLAYLNNLTTTGSEGPFTMDIPDYTIQYRDVLYVSIKAMAADGMITDFLSSSRTVGNVSYAQGEAGQSLSGYDVKSSGNIVIPVLGSIQVAGLNLENATKIIQSIADTHFNNATVDCKLLSFKFTVIGEVRTPGTYINYNNYLTVLEAIGRAGGIGDYGRRDKLMVIRPVEGGTKTFTLNLQDKKILTSEAYFLLPNDVVIVEPESKKIFNLNLPTYSFVLTATASLITTTLLLINYFNK
jgi:polysaccharide biosynthesis/export protein